MLRFFLLVPCVLICLACATPFPLDSLEEGMTTEAMRANFGEPEANSTTEPEGMDSSWSYVHEERNWFNTVLFSSILLPHCILFTPFILSGDGHPCFSWYVDREPVVLQFAEGKLASWEVLPDPRGSVWDQGWYSPGQNDYFTHQMMGHPGHIHPPGC